MKTILLTLLATLLSLSAFAETAPDPEGFCKSNPACTDTMKAITEDFALHGIPVDLSAGPAVGSGACFHIQRGLDPNDTHYGVVLLDPNNGAPTFDAAFSFFNKSDPWTGMNAAQVRDILDKDGSYPVPALITKKEAQAEIKNSGSDIRYWLRSYPEQKQVLLISQWIFSSDEFYIFCRMSVH